jgi:hypothetical protein
MSARRLFYSKLLCKLASDTDEEMETNFADVIVRPTHVGTWSVEIPSAGPSTSAFVSFASDPEQALRLAMSMRPQSRIAVCVTEHENSGVDWWSSL